MTFACFNVSHHDRLTLEPWGGWDGVGRGALHMLIASGSSHNRARYSQCTLCNVTDLCHFILSLFVEQWQQRTLCENTKQEFSDVKARAA